MLFFLSFIDILVFFFLLFITLHKKIPKIIQKKIFHVCARSLLPSYLKKTRQPITKARRIYCILTSDTYAVSWAQYCASLVSDYILLRHLSFLDGAWHRLSCLLKETVFFHFFGFLTSSREVGASLIAGFRRYHRKRKTVSLNMRIGIREIGERAQCVKGQSRIRFGVVFEIQTNGSWIYVIFMAD